MPVQPVLVATLQDSYFVLSDIPCDAAERERRRYTRVRPMYYTLSGSFDNRNPVGLFLSRVARNQHAVSIETGT